MPAATVVRQRHRVRATLELDASEVGVDAGPVQLRAFRAELASVHGDRRPSEPVAGEPGGVAPGLERLDLGRHGSGQGGGRHGYRLRPPGAEERTTCAVRETGEPQHIRTARDTGRLPGIAEREVLEDRAESGGRTLP